MDNKKSLIITAVAALVILLLIFGTIYLLVRVIQNRQRAASTPTPSPVVVVSSPSPTVVTQPTPVASPSPFKTFNGTNFRLTYPKEWGILTCNNSSNVELDPQNGTDQLRVRCDRAVKPITIMVGATCTGQATTIGNMTVNKTVTTATSGTNYRWCTSSPALDITHRVSTTDNRPAFSKLDFSAQIEQMIGRLGAPAGGS